MSLEENIKDTIAKKMEEGIVEKLVAEQLEKGIYFYRIKNIKHGNNTIV